MRARTRPYVRFTLPSDEHEFVGRIFDLSIVAYHFDTYQELAKHADCKYAYDVNCDLTALVRRVESLNLVGDMLWPEKFPESFFDFPISRYEWLSVTVDAFLMRYISAVDCAAILVNAVFEAGLTPQKCTILNLRKAQVSNDVIELLEMMIEAQGALRDERNARFHHGTERDFSQDDQTFRLASRSEAWGQCLTGSDRLGRKIDPRRSFREGLVTLQREFNQATRKLVRHLDQLYEILHEEFESRFAPRFKAGPFSRTPTKEVGK